MENKLFEKVIRELPKIRICDKITINKERIILSETMCSYKNVVKYVKELKKVLIEFDELLEEEHEYCFLQRSFKEFKEIFKKLEKKLLLR